jgi:hypothetical protein
MAFACVLVGGPWDGHQGEVGRLLDRLAFAADGKTKGREDFVYSLDGTNEGRLRYVFRPEASPAVVRARAEGRL